MLERAMLKGTVLKRATVGAIHYYRKTGGGFRWFGIDCNFEPSCSAYTLDAIELYGLRKGLSLGWNRVRRCQQKDNICKCIEPIETVALANKGMDNA